MKPQRLTFEQALSIWETKLEQLLTEKNPNTAAISTCRSQIAWISKKIEEEKNGQ